MTPSSNTQPGLTAAWAKTHERVVGKKRPGQPDANPSGAGEPPADPGPKPERTNFKVLNIRIPRDVHKTLRRISIETEESLQNTVIRALSEYAAARSTES